MIVMAASPLETLMKLEQLAEPVLELVLEAIGVVRQSTTKRDAARRLATLAAKKVLLG